MINSLQYDIDELCFRVMRLSLNTRHANTPDSTDKRCEQTAEGKERSTEKGCSKRRSVEKKAEDQPPRQHSQHPRPPGQKRKQYNDSPENDISLGDNSAGKLDEEFVPVAKKRCRGLPAFQPSLHANSLSCSSSNKAQLSCASAPPLAAQHHTGQESCKAEGPNTGKKDRLQPEPLQPKPAEREKPSGKRKCKTKHLNVQGSRKRSFLAMDDPFAIEDARDMVAVPKKRRRLAEPILHHGSSPAITNQQRLHKQLQQPPSLPTL